MSRGEAAQKKRGRALRGKSFWNCPAPTTQDHRPSNAPHVLSAGKLVRAAKPWSFALGPSHLALEARRCRYLGPANCAITGIHDGAARKLSASSSRPRSMNRRRRSTAAGLLRRRHIFGEPDVLLMDLAIATTRPNPASPWIAAQASPAGTPGAFEARAAQQL
jgi:hypothetical protein